MSQLALERSCMSQGAASGQAAAQAEASAAMASFKHQSEAASGGQLFSAQDVDLDDIGEEGVAEAPSTDELAAIQRMREEDADSSDFFSSDED